MAKYSLVLRDPGNSFADLSPAEMQAIVQRYTSWREGVQKAGKFVGSQKLRDGSGRIVRRSNGRVMVSDGPYTEGKEVIGGLFVIEAGSYDEALAIANDCPHLEFGSVEVREVEIFR